MNKLEIAPAPRLTVVIDSKEYAMTKPNLGAVADFEEEIDAAKSAGKPITRVVMKLVTTCGLPADVVYNLTAEQLQAIVETLTSAKKN